MLRNHILLATAVACSFVGEMTIADADIGQHPYRLQAAQIAMGSTGERPRDLTDKLDLDANQRQQIQAIRDNYRSEMGAQYGVMRQEQSTMRALLLNDNSSRTELEAQHRVLTQVRRELADLHFQQMLDIREVLTPEQRAELAQHMAEKRRGDRPQNSSQSQGRWRSWFGRR
ncbi:hypothetical protein NIES970_21680 [[Synechococcus] sp. NIES-970]|uniref:Spy/CpxP family protein refolding chaperone n=1 Tax=Picosynechococcus sp. NKBG15041c TaxID=1407650 RepID=UPI00040C6B3A|nr:Spy/CpxP family protein refolding chaperone [Picosynechococcus sp. NKBG15041c]BAW97219.1 hypothetical protein NIES970_21680 [[Synechococcus] sp. NIES-970]